MADIFLSYSRKDAKRARQIVNALAAEGFRVFWDHQLLPGTWFRSKLANELSKARCVVVLWSRNSVGSRFVTAEAAKGIDRGCLVPIRIDDVELPLEFGELHTADLFHWNGDREDPDFKLLVQGVAQHAPLPPPESVQEPVPKAPRGMLGWGSATREVAPAPPVPFKNRALRPTLLLAAVFLVNWMETSLDSWLTPTSLGKEAGYPITYAFRWFEWGLSFASHDATSVVASHGYTLSYFVVLPALCLFVVWNLARRPDPMPYRALSLGVAIDYAVSLPFFVFFPVPERWYFFESEALLLSDRWSDGLIEFIRPISGLDNSFPSTHVSLAVLAATACFIFDVPWRKCTVPLGATVVLATFVLGVHWVPDMLAGVAVGFASMLLATRLTRAGRLSFLWGAAA